MFTRLVITDGLFVTHGIICKQELITNANKKEHTYLFSGLTYYL